ncbi:ATP-binding protein [Bifidobacterium simiarum]|uniref:ATP-binding protein n=1 Tax=Bifidobacterium simiarum TaxID=2045441 RepID=UPI001BDD0EFE|nr:ATP-binding protein [Bifidobacterium simiarum]MBT1167299.1 ATP-binding protein [Bifidobacterium simiarum]
MIPRTITNSLNDMLTWFPVVSVTGPRQSGKSTLVKTSLPDYEYVNLEDATTRAIATEDPVGFIRSHNDHLIIDEAQHAPGLFSQIQVAADERGTMGQYVLSGSQNFLMEKRIGQSLAGRVGMLQLLPLSYAEALQGKENLSVDDFMFTGGYPHLYDVPTPADIYFRNYIATYVQRDVAEYLDVRNASDFNTFVHLCAENAGALLNISTLAKETGISFNTAKAWLSILEASFIVFRLRPYSSNTRKRLIKTPKLYFYDNGLLNYLLGIRSAAELQSDSKRGDVFENLIISETVKRYLNANIEPNLYFYRDTNQAEIDLVDCTQRRNTRLIEIKSGMTPRADYFKHLATIGEDMNVPREQRIVIYRGDEGFLSKNGRYVTADQWLRGSAESAT